MKFVCDASSSMADIARVSNGNNSEHKLKWMEIHGGEFAAWHKRQDKTTEELRCDVTVRDLLFASGKKIQITSLKRKRNKNFCVSVYVRVCLTWHWTAIKAWNTIYYRTNVCVCVWEWGGSGVAEEAMLLSLLSECRVWFVTITNKRTIMIPPPSPIRRYSRCCCCCFCRRYKMNFPHNKKISLR